MYSDDSHINKIKQYENIIIIILTSESKSRNTSSEQTQVIIEIV